MQETVMNIYMDVLRDIFKRKLYGLRATTLTGGSSSFSYSIISTENRDQQRPSLHTPTLAAHTRALEIFILNRHSILSGLINETIIVGRAPIVPQTALLLKPRMRP